jgi:hypothetical protein
MESIGTWHGRWMVHYGCITSVGRHIECWEVLVGCLHHQNVIVEGTAAESDYGESGDMTYGNGDLCHGVWMSRVTGLMLVLIRGCTIGIRDLRESEKVHFV